MSNLTEKEFKNEYNTVEHFWDKSTWIQIKANRLITNFWNRNILCKIYNITNSEVLINECSENKRNFKLPKLELHEFDGIIKDWLHF